MKSVIVVLLVVLVMVGFAGCASLAQERAAEGAAIGAGVGYIAGGKGGAVAGGLIGGGVGGVIGSIEDSHSGCRITSLPGLAQERVLVLVRGSWNESLRAVVEDELRGRGAIVVSAVGRSYHQQQNLGATFVAEVVTKRSSSRVFCQIRLIDCTNNVVRLIGAGDCYSYRNDFQAYADSVREAVSNLH